VDALARTKFGAVTGALGASGLFKQYASTGEEALTPAANSNGAGAFFYEEIPLGSLTNPDALEWALALRARWKRRGAPHAAAPAATPTEAAPPAPFAPTGRWAGHALPWIRAHFPGWKFQARLRPLS